MACRGGDRGLEGRAWRILPIGADADTGRIVAATLTGGNACDASRVGDLLNQVGGPAAFFTADGACDQVAGRCPDAAVVAPPRANAVPSSTAGFTPTPRDRQLQALQPQNRVGWQTASGRDRRALVEADISCFKRVIGAGRPRRPSPLVR